jgi:hypothetical protein
MAVTKVFTPPKEQHKEKTQINVNRAVAPPTKHLALLWHIPLCLVIDERREVRRRRQSGAEWLRRQQRAGVEAIEHPLRLHERNGRRQLHGNLVKKEGRH